MCSNCSGDYQDSDRTAEDAIVPYVPDVTTLVVHPKDKEAISAALTDFGLLTGGDRRPDTKQAYMTLRDKYGWPVETIKGRPVTNFIRRVLHTNVLQTWKRRRKAK